MNKQAIKTRIGILESLIIKLESYKQGLPTFGLLSQTDIAGSILELEAVIKRLTGELGEGTYIEQFKDTPWVIKENNLLPTYYQLIGPQPNNKSVMVLGRNGSTRNVPYVTFVKDYRPATEAEVKQHIEYLSKVNKPYIRPMGGSFPTPKLQTIRIDFGTSVKPKTKPKDADFYSVTLKQGRGCTKYHETYEQAETEAIRLSKEDGKKAYVMGVVGVIEAKLKTTYDVAVAKF